MAAVLVALDLGGIVVGVGHSFVSPWSGTSLRRCLEVVPVDVQVGQHLGKQSLADLLPAVLDGRPAIADVKGAVGARSFRREEADPESARSRPAADPSDELAAGHRVIVSSGAVAVEGKCAVF